MTVFEHQSKRNQIFVFGGVLLWMLVATVFINGMVMTVSPRSLKNEFIPKTVFADAGSTTCGTYTAGDCGVDDCGINIPIVDQAQLDADCVSPQTQTNVCFNEVYPDCFCQQGSGGNCGSVGGPPTPPQATLVDMGAVWQGTFRWWTGVSKSDNCIHYAYQSLTTPQPWRCIWGTGEPGCAGNLNTYCDGSLAVEHVLVKTDIPENRDYYFGVRSGSPAPELKSEVRRFRTYVEDFSITVTPPANTKIVTGEQTDEYIVTVEEIGGATGIVTLSVDNQTLWVPPADGITVTWPSGNTVDLSNPQPKTFRIATDDGSPPSWPPTTQANIYDFRVKGTHATLPERSANVIDGLTVMDYHMIPSVGQVDMNAAGDSDSFDVQFEWLSPGWQYDRVVALTHNNFPGLTVTLSHLSVTKDNPASGVVTVDLTTSGMSSGPHMLIITGTGNPGGLQREVQVNINIGLEPDFALGIATSPQNVDQGQSVGNTVTVTSLNHFIEPVVLTGYAIKQGESNPEPSITLGFNPAQPAPPDNGSIPSSITLTTTGATPCLPGAGQRYTVTVEGRDNVQVGPPDAMRNVSYDLFVICAVAPSFTMVAVPNPQSVFQGDTATYQVTVTSQNGFNDTVNLDLAPGSCTTGGLVCTFPRSIAVAPGVPGVFNFVVDTDPSTPTGGYSMELDGDAQNGPETGLVIIILNVEAGPDYTFTITPDPLDLTIGSSGAYTVTITPSGGFATPIRISWTMNPANPNVGFSPTSGNLIVIPGNSGPLTVTANPGSLGNYLLDFTATPVGSGPVKHLDGVQLNIQNAICNGDCPNICADQNNQPLVPQQTCTQDTDCPVNYHCASQTCRGVAGCTIDPPPGPFDCNKDICYDDSGDFVIPPPAPDCYASWPRCKQYDILKVKKDRLCDKWLSCEEAVVYDDPVSKKEVTQCLSLGVCTLLASNGECANWVPEPSPKANLVYPSPFSVTGATSLIRK